jgi:hypothetical protein
MSADNAMKQKHYELLGSNTMRYVTAMQSKPTISNAELGKAIEMMVQLIQREAERDAREEVNKAQDKEHPKAQG